MALARIISNSDLCSRELAINLLERGYAVEIVSPDAIPDNLADLELRVETGPSDLLTANVAAHGETRSATLEFIHQLKSPSLDLRKPARVVLPEGPTSDGTIPALGISANPLAVAGPVATPANPSPMVAAREAIPVSISALAHVITPVVVDRPEEIVTLANPVSAASSADPPKKPAAFSEVTSLIVLPSPSREATQKVEQLTEAKAPLSAPPVFRLVIPKPSLRSFSIPAFRMSYWRGLLSVPLGWVRRAAVRPPRWFGLTALGFAGVVALGLALELAPVDIGGPPSDSGSAIPGAKNGAPVDGFSLLPQAPDEGQSTVRQAYAKASTLDPSSQEKPTAGPVAPTPHRGSVNHSIASTKLRASPPARTARVVPKSEVVRHFGDDVAPDTITYFNRPGAKPIPVGQLAHQRDSHKGGQGAVVPNSALSKTVPTTGSGK
jgi:hypothetical protein